ncbi:MAG: alpha-D-ribose 1-methylphosphonate 5-triphosphate diphosphatase [Rhodobacteraceae bacterium]|nr:alpha-D-ribose 1-methylphosphonate 5-triphosphate diphosphatase [Paracoccaceae bacterium]
MTKDVIIANARLILPDEIICGAIRIKDGLIDDIAQTSVVPSGAIDAEGDYIAPGLVELHTDNLERHLSPRPKVNWPHRSAIVAHDRELAGAGITTVFDALRVGSILSDGSYKKYARALADEILSMRGSGALRISHHIHLRAETCSETLLEELDDFGPADRIGIVSMMDHTPGQRQFGDIQKYKDYVCGKHGMNEAAFADYVTFLQGLRATLGDRHETATVAAAARYGATLASHDDTTTAQVETSHKHGVKLAEFPTTIEAADACHKHGIKTIMGGPNIVRGGSHSGNVAALDLARADRLDILSSDYVPAGLLMAVVQLGNAWDNLARSIATASANPAQAVGLTDRGKLQPNMRADLIRFAVRSDIPLLNGTWHGGVQVA